MDHQLTSGGRAMSPTRESVLRAISAASSPISILELTEQLGVHENTVRMHVAALHTDGFLGRTRGDADGERGRPAWLWFRQERRTSPYVALVTALARQLRAESDDPWQAAHAAGAIWGKSLAAQHAPGTPATAQHAAETVTEILRAEGFAPTPVGGAFELKQCPLIEAAGQDPDIVCTMHLGMVSGALEQLGVRDGGSTLTPFISPGTCALTLKITETS